LVEIKFSTTDEKNTFENCIILNCKQKLIQNQKQHNERFNIYNIAEKKSIENNNNNNKIIINKSIYLKQNKRKKKRVKTL